jgi:hypothetical protein
MSCACAKLVMSLTTEIVQQPRRQGRLYVHSARRTRAVPPCGTSVLIAAIYSARRTSATTRPAATRIPTASPASWTSFRMDNHAAYELLSSTLRAGLNLTGTLDLRAEVRNADRVEKQTCPRNAARTRETALSIASCVGSAAVGPVPTTTPWRTAARPVVCAATRTHWATSGACHSKCSAPRTRSSSASSRAIVCHGLHLDCSRSFGPWVHVGGDETMVRMLMYLGATQEQIAQYEDQRRRSGQGSVHVNLLAANRKNLLKVDWSKL